MEEKKIQDRIRKYDYDHNNFMPKGDNKLLQAREKTSLQLRKNKLEEEIMHRRMKSQITNDVYPYSNLGISIDELEQSLPVGFIQEFESREDKVEIIKELLKVGREFDSSPMQMFGIVKLKDISCTWDGSNGEICKLDIEFFELLLSILFNSHSVKIQYEILWILINLTNDSNYYCMQIINNDQVMVNLYKLTLSNELGIVSSALWIFNNITDDEETLDKIAKSIPIVERLIDWVAQITEKNKKSNLYLEEYSNAVSFINKSVSLNSDTYSLKFENVYPGIVSTFSIQVDELFKITIGHNQASSTERILRTDIITKIMTIIDIVIKAEDSLLRYFLNEGFIKSLFRIFEMKSFSNTKLHREDIYTIHNIQNTGINITVDNNILLVPILITRNQMILSCRILGALITGANDQETDFILQQGIIEVYDSVLQEILLSNSYDSALLKEMAWSVSNITAGTVSQIKYVLKQSNLPCYFLRIAETFQDGKYTCEALYIFYNAFTRGDDECKIFLVTAPVFSTSYNVINLIVTSICMEKCKENVLLALGFLRTITTYLKDLSQYGLLKNLKMKLESLSITIILERLQLHSDEEISELANFLISEYWDIEEIYALNTEYEKCHPNYRY